MEGNAPTISPTVESIIRELEEVRAELHTSQNENRTLTERIARLNDLIYSDCQILSNELIDQANKRGWCEVYDEIVENLNRAFAVLAIKEREREWTIDITVEGSISIETTIIVKAASFDEALDMARTDPSDYADLDELLELEIRSRGFDSINIDTI